MNSMLEHPIISLIILPIVTGLAVAYIYDAIKNSRSQKNKIIDLSLSDSKENVPISENIQPNEGEIKLNSENFERLINYIEEGKLSEELSVFAQEISYLENNQKKIFKDLDITFKKKLPPAKLFNIYLDEKKMFGNAIKFEFDDETNDSMKILSISNIKQSHPFILRIITETTKGTIQIIPKYDRKYSVHDLREWYHFILNFKASSQLKLIEKNNLKNIIRIPSNDSVKPESQFILVCEQNLLTLNNIENIKKKGLLKKINSLPVFLKYSELVSINELHSVISKGYIEKYHVNLTAKLNRKQIFFLIKQGKILKSMSFHNPDFYRKENILEIEEIKLKGVKLEMIEFKIKNRFLSLLEIIIFFYKSSHIVNFIPSHSKAHIRVSYEKVY
jgi:hypothetical protein